MTRRLIHILLLFLCMLLGWVLGYIKVPYIELDDTFWIGIIGCLGIMGFIISLFRIWNVQKAINPDETPQSSLNVSMFKSLINYKFLVAIIIIGLISACLIAYYHTKQLNEELKMTQVALEDFKSNTNVEQQRINISLKSMNNDSLTMYKSNKCLYLQNKLLIIIFFSLSVYTRESDLIFICR